MTFNQNKVTRLAISKIINTALSFYCYFLNEHRTKLTITFLKETKSWLVTKEFYCIDEYFAVS